ncbi:MAG: hypothetical protein K2O95_06070 [Clostridia bacterium]|nr:hypothetical protein [Clostridia bacterium]MDE6758089.1 hypothetical protein [Clostridia bacterium]MDE7079661.1 hypothetical protein [Clostridia bacterium]
MITKNSFSILISKFSLVYQLILAVLIALLIFGIIGYAILAPTLSGYMSDLKDLEIGNTVKEYLSSIFGGADMEDGIHQGMTVEYQNLVNALKQVGEVTRSHLGAIWGGIIAVVIILFLFSVYFHMCMYTVTDTLHAFMSSDSEYGFTSNFIANVGKSIKFSLAYVGMYILWIIIIIGLSLGLGFLVGAWNNFFGLVVAYFTAILALAIRRSLFAGWMPAYVVSDMTVNESLVANFKMASKTFRDTLGVYFVIYLASLLLSVTVGVLTLGFGLFIVLGVTNVLSQAYDMVTYYHYCSKKYYKDAQHVVDPTKKYKDAVR